MAKGRKKVNLFFRLIFLSDLILNLALPLPRFVQPAGWWIFVRFGAQPKELQGDLIFELKEHQKGNDICVEAKSLPRPGASIRVKKGQFAGIDAIFQEQDGETRSIMLVKMISQVVPVSISNSDLELGC